MASCAVVPQKKNAQKTVKNSTNLRELHIRRRHPTRPSAPQSTRTKHNAHMPPIVPTPEIILQLRTKRNGEGLVFRK
jgi:hypothetical protein